jgi:HD-like signal output (HDOD) protein
VEVWAENADNLAVDLKTLEIKISRSENLPALPQVVTSVLRLADDPNSSARAVEQVIERDPAMTAKILRVANSSYYASGAVPSISRAISLLGLNALRSLVVSVAYHQIVTGKSHSTRFDKRQFWQHSLATATTARILGKLRMPMKAEELYSVGMMHDIGLIVLDKFAPEALDEALNLMARDPISLQQALQTSLGYDQSDVGYALAVKWNLSPMMQDAIRHVFRPFDAEFMETAAIITIANRIADQAGYPNNSTVLDAGFTDDLLDAVNLPPQQCEAIVAVVQAEVAKAAAGFGIK